MRPFLICSGAVLAFVGLMAATYVALPKAESTGAFVLRSGEKIAPPGDDRDPGEIFRTPIDVGDEAPDVLLTDVFGKRVPLARHLGQRPTVLVFGSYTCPLFRAVVPKLRNLHGRHGDQAQFLLVYLREAHPGSLLYARCDGREELIDFTATQTAEELRTRASVCLESLDLTLPVLVDTEDGAAGRAFGGWPARCVVIDKDGRVAYASDLRAQGLGLDDVESWLRQNAG